MSKAVQLTEELYQYLWSSMNREPPILQRLREETAALPMAAMQIAPDQGQFMALLAKLMGVRRALEIGTFTGYSALALALALPRDARIVCCDLSREWTDIARRYWREAGVAEQIDLVLGPALATLDRLLGEGAADSFDLAFIDADKANYRDYFERSLALVRPGGLIMIDNVLWGGAVIDRQRDDADTAAIRALNASLRLDDRIDIAMLPVADGLTLALKR
jgi:predicted O-methyltransferase YrrM